MTPRHTSFPANTGLLSHFFKQGAPGVRFRFAFRARPPHGVNLSHCLFCAAGQ